MHTGLSSGVNLASAFNPLSGTCQLITDGLILDLEVTPNVGRLQLDG